MPVKIEHGLGQPLHDQLDGLGVDLLRVFGLLAIKGEFDRRRAAAEADLQPAAAELVEHADFLDHPQRMMQRHRVDQRPEAQLPRALRDRGQEHIRRGRHAERRRMMLGEVIGVEAGAIVGLDDFQAILVVVREIPPPARSR